MRRAQRAAAFALGILLCAGARAESAPPRSEVEGLPVAPPADPDGPNAGAASVGTGAGGGAPTEPAAPRGVVAPQPLGPTAIAWPQGAPAGVEPVTVQVLLTIGESGEVTAVELQQGAGEPFDSAVLEGAKAFRFSPALIDGKPTAVAVPFTQTFAPPAVPPTDAAGVPFDALIEGIVAERGTRRPVAEATVVATDSKGERTAVTDAQGRFSLPVAAGESRIRIVGSNLQPFARVETLEVDQRLKVKYLVDRQRYDPYESVVIGSRERTEVSRTSLSGREIHQLPGTFGDPFRVVSALPGVTQVMSLLPMPVVRGSSPGDTGVFLDGMRLPLLYHLLGGPSVIHPEFIERIDFYPGGFPATYGGYTGGIVDGQTVRPKPGERVVDLDLNDQQVGAFVRHQIPGTGINAAVAGRYGYPGLMLDLINAGISLDYWDYQLRFDGGPRTRAWTVFFFGASDELATADDPNDPDSPMTTQALFRFHRLDLRLRVGEEAARGEYRLVFGYDETKMAGDTLGAGSWFVDPQASWRFELSRWLRVENGIELLVRRNDEADGAGQATGEVEEASQAVQGSGLLYNGGAWVQAPLQPLESLRVIPGVRADVYANREATQWSIDPRLTVRWRADERREVWLKGVVGRYHQPPRLFVPLPGLDQSALELGLLASTQFGLGVETKVPGGLELDLQGYYNHKNPVVFDLQVNPSDVQPTGPDTNPGELPTGATGDSSDLSRFFAKRLGRSYGLEVILRKRDPRAVYGWLAYTFSRSERMDDAGWAAFDFDRTHILNAVLGVRLPRNWELGGRLLLQSGTPLTTLTGYNQARTGWQFRTDLRVDKRVVYNRWMFDFYVDIVNATVAPETGGLVGSSEFRYVLPTIGLRAVL